MDEKKLFDAVYSRHIEAGLLPPIGSDRYSPINLKTINDLIAQTRLADALSMHEQIGDVSIEKLTVHGYGEVDRHGIMAGTKRDFRLYRNLNLLTLPFRDQILKITFGATIKKYEPIEDLFGPLLDDLVAYDDRNDWRSYLPTGEICMGGKQWPSGVLGVYSLFHYHQQGQRHQWENPKFHQKEFVYLFKKN